MSACFTPFCIAPLRRVPQQELCKPSLGVYIRGNFIASAMFFSLCIYQYTVDGIWAICMQSNVMPAVVFVMFGAIRGVVSPGGAYCCNGYVNYA